MRACKQIFKMAIEIAAVVAVLYVLVPLVQQQLNIAQQIGNGPSGAADAPSEFDALNSGMHYYMDGFLKNAGLPDRAHPSHKRYDDPADVVDLVLIYTHYPPGPNWLTGLAMKIFGPKDVPSMRLFPITFSVAGLLITYALLRKVAGCVLAAGAIITVLQFPMTTEMMHGLFYHPYALTLTILQMSFIFNRLETKSRLSWRSLSLITGMSFLQGWLSFDWAFVVMFYPLAVVSCWRDSASRWEMYKAIAFSVFGFAFAHFLHFCQVWIVAPHFEHAFNDLFGAAKFRMKGEGSKLIPEDAITKILNHYIFTLFPSRSQAAHFSWLMPSIGVTITLFVGGIGCLKSRITRCPRLVAPALISMAIAFVLSLLWALVMRNHSLEQGHWLFLPRHFIVVLFSCVLVSIFELHALARMVMEFLRSLSFHSFPGFRRKYDQAEEAIHNT